MPLYPMALLFGTDSSFFLKQTTKSGHICINRWCQVCFVCFDSFHVKFTYAVSVEGGMSFSVCLWSMDEKLFLYLGEILRIDGP